MEIDSGDNWLKLKTNARMGNINSKQQQYQHNRALEMSNIKRNV